MKKAKEKKPSCPKCRTNGYTESVAPGDGRPMYTCTTCGFKWTSGLSGGEWKGKGVPDAAR